jgi:protein-L-isoaspartate O-methyltransferase
MQVLKNLAELDEKLAECDSAATISDDALRRVFASFRMDPPAELPAEPLSSEYAGFQLELYQKLAGKAYRVQNEVTVFDVESAVRRPFPYCTGGVGTTADQYTAIGALLRRLQLSPGARILEFGPGWGNTTLVLALLGFHVTAIDIEPRFCELIRRRAALHGVRVETINADFNWVEKVTEPYDAAIFFECFHHASDHRRLLRALQSALTPEGCILFAGEPISPDFPMPWGLRMDGQALWSIRKHGWFELGFNDSYFIEILAREGFSAAKYPSSDSPIADVWEARKCRLAKQEFSAADPRIVVPSNMRDASGIRLERLANAWGFFGPYVAVAAGTWLARAVLRPDAPREGRGTFDVCTDRGRHVISSRDVRLESLGPNQNSLEITASFASSTPNVEVRWFCESPVCLSVDRIELVPLA